MQGDELKAIRKAAHMTQAELANAFGLSTTFIGLMERGEKPIENRTRMAARYIEICMHSHTMIAAAQNCRLAARKEYTLDSDELLDIADWLDLAGSLPRDWDPGERPADDQPASANPPSHA